MYRFEIDDLDLENSKKNIIHEGAGPALLPAPAPEPEHWYSIITSHPYISGALLTSSSAFAIIAQNKKSESSDYLNYAKNFLLNNKYAGKVMNYWNRDPITEMYQDVSDDIEKLFSESYTEVNDIQEFNKSDGYVYLKKKTFFFSEQPFRTCRVLP